MLPTLKRELPDAIQRELLLTTLEVQAIREVD